MKSFCIVTTSWDDGSVLDLRLAKLLDKYNLKGTFYVPKHYLPHALSERDLLDIAARHEIGAHGINHKDLTQLTTAEVLKEIRESKDFLESILNQEITMFAYPFGSYNQTVKQCVEQCGFIGARTINPFSLSYNFDRFKMGVTTIAYPFPFGRKSTWNYPFSRTLIQPFLLAYRDILQLKLPLKSFLGWSKLVKELFIYTLSHDGIFHLWGHSWEIEKCKMWKKLEAFFEFIAHNPEVIYLTNSSCLKYISCTKKGVN